jgi:hypothetical protein
LSSGKAEIVPKGPLTLEVSCPPKAAETPEPSKSEKMEYIRDIHVALLDWIGYRTLLHFSPRFRRLDVYTPLSIFGERYVLAVVHPYAQNSRYPNTLR